MKKSGWLLLGVGLLSGGSLKPVENACVNIARPQPQPYLVHYYGPVDCQSGKDYVQVGFDFAAPGVFAGLATWVKPDRLIQLTLAGKERPSPSPKCFGPEPIDPAHQPLTLDLKLKITSSDGAIPVLVRMPGLTGVSAILIEPVPGG